MSRPQLSIVIPAYNEERRLPSTIRKVQNFCKSFGANQVEVIIVIEKSDDRTVEVARETIGEHPSFVLIENKVQRGKGYAVRTGMLRARGEIVLFMDADLSVPLSDVSAFVERFEAQPDIDVLIGSRQHAQSEILLSQNALRRQMGQTFNHLIQWLTGIPLRDTQCGFKAFRHAAVRAIFTRQQLDGFAFDVEVLLLAQKLGFQMEEMPVRWKNSPESHVHIVSDSLRMLFDAWRVRKMVNLRKEEAATEQVSAEKVLSEYR